MNFAHRLKQLRKSFDLTQESFANKISSSRSTIAGYETERKQPDYETLTKIADFFNVSVDYLLGRTDIKNIDKSNEVDPLTKRLEGLSEETKKELFKHLELLEIKEKLDKSKDETSSALENEA